MQYLLFCFMQECYIVVCYRASSTFLLPPPIVLEGRHTCLDIPQIPHKTTPAVPCRSLYVKSYVWDRAGTHCPAQFNSSSNQLCLLCPGGTGGLWLSVLAECLRKIWIITYFSHIILSMQFYLTFFTDRM